MTVIPYQPPAELIESIRAGNCIAFVGAGFTQPCMPSWRGLLELLTARISEPRKRAQLEAWLKDAKSSRDLEGIAEVVADALGANELPRHVKSVLEARAIGDETQARLQKLRQIPFHLVLTTNFDHVIHPAVVPRPDTFGGLLTKEQRPWWGAEALWKSVDGGTAVVDRERTVKLHGDIRAPDSELIFTTKAYRARIHETPGYRTFLRTLFATRTVLFMGFSFTDAYVNDIRSEVLSVLREAGAHRSLDYAILEDVPDLMADHLEKNEGLVALGFDTTAGPDGTRDFRGFDRWIDAIHARCSPAASLRQTIDAKKILWVDPSRTNNAFGFEALSAKPDRGPGAELTPAHDVESALERLRANRSAQYDFVITHWGHQGDGAQSNAERLLEAMRSEDLRAPVIVFASGHFRAENRRKALQLGAFAYCDRWPVLFRTIDELVNDPDVYRREL